MNQELYQLSAYHFLKDKIDPVLQCLINTIIEGGLFYWCLKIKNIHEM